MASQEGEAEKMMEVQVPVLAKQVSPVKDAVRTLEAQLASSGSAEDESASTSVQAAPIQVPPGYETVTLTPVPESQVANVQQQQVIIHEGQAIEMEQEIRNVLMREQQQQQQEQVQIHVQENGSQQILVQHIPENVETVHMSENTTLEMTESGEAVAVINDGSAQSVLAGGVQVQPQTEGAKPVFKCVAVNSDGAPDWSKVMNLNKDILREVLEKHGISMDPSEWPMQSEEDPEAEAERKSKKKAKKAKKKKFKEKNRKYKDGDIGDGTYCDVCCKQFDNHATLKQHMKIHDEESEGLFKCSICSLVFQRKVGLRAHIRKSHPDVYTKEEETAKDDGDFNCEEEGCERSFTTKMGLSQHINQHHKGLGKKKSTLRKESGELVCEHCNKTFTLPHKLAQHKIMHTDERPFKCTQCEGTFKHHSSLRTHELIHSNKDACSCPVCGTMFKRAQYVRRHMIRVHDLLGVNYVPPAPVKRYPCEHCNRAYERRSELADHMNSHTGAKPHLCEICAKGFAHKRALDVHRKTHTLKGAFHCDMCGKVFGSKSRMREHRVIHTGEKPFICQQCGSRFAHRANLREHLKSVHKSGMEPVPRGRRKGQRNKTTVMQIETTPKDTTQEQPQETLQYEILTTRPHPQIEEAQQQQAQQQQAQQGAATTVIPVGIHHHQQHVAQEQAQQIMYQEIQLQPVVVPANANVQQVQGGQIEARHDDLASVAQIVLQLHTEGGTTYTVQ